MFHSARAALSLRALPVAGVAAASAALVQRRRQEAPKCEPIDPTSVGLGVGVAVGAVMIMKMGSQEKGPPKFEARLRGAYNESKTARAVLAESGAGHADLVKASLAEQRDVEDPALAVANHIRELWAEVLAEAFHFPKTFFISTTTPMGQMDVAGSNKRTLQTSNKKLGTYKLSIPTLKHNKVAVKWGIDRLAAKFDRNNDGVLDFHEFATLVLVQADFYAEVNGHAKRSKTEVLQLLYTVLDDDGDQLVTREEFESFIVMASKLGITAKHDAKLHENLWKKYDADGNGVLSYAEFLVFAREMLDLSQFPGDFPK